MTNSRRDFIKNCGCLTIGFSMAGSYSLANSVTGYCSPTGLLKNNASIDSWLKILANGQVRVFTGKLELGQGIKTAIAQVAAEELELDLTQVEVVIAATGITPDEGYTAGSGSIENSAMSVRNAAAAARHQLLELASEKFKSPVDELLFAGGRVSVKADQRSLTFNQILNGQQLTGQVRSPVDLKSKSDYRLVGKPVPRADILHMVRADQVYVQDLRFSGMVHARIIRPPAYGATIRGFDEQALRKKIPGILKVVVNGSFIGVITKEEYPAVQAVSWFNENARWSEGRALPEGKDLAGYLKTKTVQNRNVSKKGNPKTEGTATLKRSYYKPYIMHGSIGPSCAVAIYDKEKLSIWSHSQGVYPLRLALQKLLQIPESDIQITGVPGSGCYGHNGADDVSADAALLAIAFPGWHIRLQWSREDEHSWEPYGSAMIMELAARLDSSGTITDWSYNMWSDSHTNRPGGRPENLLPAQYIENALHPALTGISGGAYRNSEPYYTIPNQQTDAHFFQGPLRVSALRSLGAYGNIFAIESFMDELAEKAGIDPYEFRLKHLNDERALDVIKKLQSLTASVALKTNHGLGIAFSRYKNNGAYCAAAAWVSVEKSTNTVSVIKMWAVIDAGEIINPDGVRNQTEGGLIQSASWTLKEQVRFDRKHITSRNWDNYPIFRCVDVPEVEVAIIDRPNEEALGAGEAAQGPAGAAIVNAIFRASGKRIRKLPVSGQEL